MNSFINFFTNIIGQVYVVMDSLIFPGTNISYIQIILGACLIAFIIKFVFGGFNDVERGFTLNSTDIGKSVKGWYSGNKSKRQVNIIDSVSSVGVNHSGTVHQFNNRRGDY